jgi:hypothetical protein
MSGWRTMRRCTAWLTLFCLVVSLHASAQEPAQATSRVRSGRWGLIDAIGYGGVGVLVGYASALGSAFSDGSDSDLSPVVLVAPIAGLAFGGAIGHNASSRINRGETPGPVTRLAVQTGAILAGATLGALASIPLIQGGDRTGTLLGSDETTATILMTAGVALGALYVYRHRSDFRTTRISIAPVRTLDSAYGLRIALQY